MWFIADVRFYLGGPTSVRGFGMYCIGPQSEGRFLFTDYRNDLNNKKMFLNQELRISLLKKLTGLFFTCSGDYLGGDAYWAGGLHLYTPLPFRTTRGGFADLFRTHFFLNAGNLCNLNYGQYVRVAWKLKKIIFICQMCLELYHYSL